MIMNILGNIHHKPINENKYLATLLSSFQSLIHGPCWELMFRLGDIFERYLSCQSACLKAQDLGLRFEDICFGRDGNGGHERCVDVKEVDDPFGWVPVGRMGTVSEISRECVVEIVIPFATR